MNKPSSRFTALLFVLLPLSAVAQKSAKHALDAVSHPPASAESTIQVSGQVTTPHGDPLPGAAIVIEAVSARATRENVSAGLGGQFDVKVPANEPGAINITISASMAGYSSARATLDAERGHNVGPIGLVLRKQPDDPELPDIDDLVAALMSRLRGAATGSALTGVSLQHFQLAMRLLDRGMIESAAPPLAEVAGQNPGCVACATLAGLTEFETGAWSIAESDLMRAGHAAITNQDKMPEPLIALGELEIWRGEMSKAAVTFLQALAMQPDQSLALQELGRTFLLERRDAVADRYLERASSHSGGPEAHLLYAEALIGLSEPRKAQDQIEAFLAGRKPKDLSAGPRELWALLTKRIDLESRPGGETMVDHSAAELAGKMPELSGLEPAADPTAIEPVLRKIGQGVEGIFQGFPNTSMQEEVEMQRLHADGKLADSFKQRFQYLLVSSLNSDNLVLNEYRADSSGMAVSPGTPERDFMVTSGFASIPLIFHPTYQIGSTFRLLGHQQVDGHDTLVIAFAERPATAKMLEDFVLKDQRTVVLTQGLAWVDADTFQILRMRTDLLKPAPEVRLTAQTTDVRYGPVHFKSKDQTLWLPQEVAVTVHWNGRVYRNLHHYSDYQLFQVGTREKIKQPVIPKQVAEQ